METVRRLAAQDRRSVGKELLVLIEDGVVAQQRALPRHAEPLSRDAQLAAWRELCGAWEDERTAEEIIADIYGARREGRGMSL